MTTAWATLPNAALIDEVMTSLQTEPQKWDAAWDAARGAAWDAARCVLVALIAYDDAGRFLKASPDLLRAMYRLDPHPMYLLLLPAAFVFTEVPS